MKQIEIVPGHQPNGITFFFGLEQKTQMLLLFYDTLCNQHLLQKETFKQKT